MASAALTSFLTGITEPIEFSFLFVAPLLFGIHCVFAGLSFMTMQLLNIKIGMTFSGGIIDFILFGIIPNRTEWWLVIPVGLVFSLIYYFGFRFAIRRWDLKTPGRDVEEELGESGLIERDGLAAEILKALGGSTNIVNLDACITRLRISVKEISAVDKNRLKGLGASGVMVVGDSLQIVFGPKSDQLKTQIQNIMEGRNTPSEQIAIKHIPPDDAVIRELETKEAGGKEMFNSFMSPIEGKLIEIANVPDSVFAQ